MDIGAIRLVLSHAAAVHGLPVSIEQVDLGRIALKRLGLVGKSNQRDRRPTDDELTKLIVQHQPKLAQFVASFERWIRGVDDIRAAAGNMRQDASLVDRDHLH